MFRPAPRRTQVHPVSHPACIESLEARQLLSGTVALGSTGILTVTGTAQKDIVRISLNATNASNLDVAINGTTSTFALADVKGIAVNAGDGNDDVEVIELNGPVNLPVTMFGGNGDDTLVGGSGNDSIDGGAGNDTIAGEDGSNTLIGGAGTDRIVFGPTDVVYQDLAPALNGGGSGESGGGSTGGSSGLGGGGSGGSGSSGGVLASGDSSDSDQGNARSGSSSAKAHPAKKPAEDTAKPAHAAKPKAHGQTEHANNGKGNEHGNYGKSGKNHGENHGKGHDKDRAHAKHGG